VNTANSAGEICPVNIIIPVYRNLAVTRRCLDSVLASDLPAYASITVIEDASPEDDLSAYCHSLADEGRVRLIVNDTNRGFVATANRGFKEDPDADVLLLNSDTEVANDWVHRLRTCAYRDDHTGTATPFSNNGSICSYPFFPESGPMPGLWDTAGLDALFRSANEHCSAEIPTAVGFCMFIRRQCLREVGGFDEENFGLGYGEECDFSMRALEKGWKNVIAPDVYVFHEGAVSFAEESGERKEKADVVMQKLHPEYDEQVARFVQDDPLWLFRRNVDALRLSQKPEDAVNIFEEFAQSQSVLKERVADIYSVLQSERKFRETQEDALRESLQKSVWLEKELAKQVELCVWQKQELSQFAEREKQFGEREKQMQVESKSLSNLLQQSRMEFSRTDEALTQAQQLVVQFREHEAQLCAQINQIQQSRSWRYTAWLRRLAGSL